MKKIKIVVFILLAAALAATGLFVARSARSAYGRSGRLPEARKALADGRIGDAKWQLKKILSEDANNEQAIVMLADIAAGEGNVPEEVRLRGRAAKLNEFNEAYERAFVKAIMRKRDWRMLGDHLIAKASRSADEEAYLAYADLMNGHKAEAVARWDEWLKTHAGETPSESSRFIKTVFAMRTADAAAMAKALEPFVDSADESVRLEALVMHGHLMMSLSSPKEALESLAAAAKLDSYAAMPLFTHALMIGGQPAEAMRLNDRYLKKFPTVKLAAEQAEWLAMAGETNRIVELKRLFPADGYDTIVLQNYLDSILAYVANDDETLRRMYPSARSTYPSVWSKMMSVRAWILSGDEKTAEHLVEDCRVLTASPSFFNCRGRGLSEAGRYLYDRIKAGDSLAGFDALVAELAAGDADLVWRIARRLAVEDFNEAAIMLYESINKFEPSVLVNLSELYAATGNHEKALSYAKSAMEKTPEDPNCKKCLERRLKEAEELK